MSVFMGATESLLRVAQLESEGKHVHVAEADVVVCVDGKTPMVKMRIELPDGSVCIGTTSLASVQAAQTMMLEARAKADEKLSADTSAAAI